LNKKKKKIFSFKRGPKLILLGFFFLINSPSYSAEENRISLKAIKKRKLWENSHWLKLVHYREDNLGSGYTSDISSKEFFF
jgi:hypothetical protein